MILGLTGFAQSGKDTVGKRLVEKHGFTRVSFADAVRDCVYALNPRVATRTQGVIRVQELVDSVGWEEAKQETDVRELLQRMGTEVGRNIISETIWLDIAEQKALAPERVVFTDVRFPNEAALVRSMDGKVVRVNRKGVGSINGHSSDAGLPDYLIDIDFYNSTTIEDLEKNVDQMVDVLITLQKREAFYA